MSFQAIHDQIISLHGVLIDRLTCTLSPKSPAYLFIRLHNTHIHIIYNRSNEAWEIDFGDHRYNTCLRYINVGKNYGTQIWHTSDIDDDRDHPKIVGVIGFMHSILDIVDINVTLHQRSAIVDYIQSRK